MENKSEKEKKIEEKIKANLPKKGKKYSNKSMETVCNTSMR